MKIEQSKEGFDMKLLVVILVVRVSSLIHRVVLSIRYLLTLLKLPSVSHLKVAVITKQDAIAERIRASILSWLPMMWLPSPACAFGSIFPDKSLAASTTRSSLPVPSLLYSVQRKSHSSTSRKLVTNGWVNDGKGLHVLRQNGKFTDVRVVELRMYGKNRPPVYDIYGGDKYIGYSKLLVIARRRAEAYFRKTRRS